jgi:hypothetical protein
MSNLGQSETSKRPRSRRLDPPLLSEGPLSGRVYVVTHGSVEFGSDENGRALITASKKYDITDQFDQLAELRGWKRPDA